MARRTRQKVAAAAAVALLLVGGAIAAVSATGQNNGARAGARATVARAHARDLATAASYLGVSSDQLAQELRSGKTLAQLASASGRGRSAQGLIAALESAKQAKLAAAAGSLPRRVTAEVNRPGGPGGEASISRAARLNALFAPRRGLGDAAAAYLGTTPAALAGELRSGKTLAELAAATPGKSSAAIVAALVAAAQRAPAADSARLGAERLARREKRLQRRVTRLVQRRFAAAGHP